MRKFTNLITWFSLAPLEHFEILFLPDKNGRTIIPLLENADVSNGKECAYLTQGFILYNFEQLLINSKDYRESIKISVEDIDNTCNLLFGRGNKVLKYLNYFRDKFNGFEIDPRDEPILYVYRTSELFIPDFNKKKIALKEWDNDIIGKLSFINGFTEFIAYQKEYSLKIME